jgi:anti-sigma regulatory factor (Ser/Thr protein kinase)
MTDLTLARSILANALRIVVFTGAGVSADSGSWKEPRPEADPYRGRGMGLMRALMHEVTVDSAATGTTVQMHARIS